MAVSAAQLRADAKYKREHTKATGLRFYPSEMDLWEWFNAQPNKQGYLKQLIREDMQRRQK